MPANNATKRHHIVTLMPYVIKPLELSLNFNQISSYFTPTVFFRKWNRFRGWEIKISEGQK